MPTVLITVRQDDADWLPTGVPQGLDLTDLVVSAVEDALGPRPPDRLPSNAGPANIIRHGPLEFSCPIDCDEGTLLLLHALESTDEPLSALVTGRLQMVFAPEHVGFDVVVQALPD